MIKYALACAFGHAFEGWFSDSADFDAQKESGLLACPICDTPDVAKQIMAPAVAGTKAQRAAPTITPEDGRTIMAAMGEVRRHVEDNFDYVGDAFAREARDIHEGRSEQRGIYGEATPADVRKLTEDGVPVAPLPPRPLEKRELN